jgi:hypothetical protein
MATTSTFCFMVDVGSSGADDGRGQAPPLPPGRYTHPETALIAVIFLRHLSVELLQDVESFLFLPVAGN